jgi:GNAT superfamily N-acetyltransferase
MMSIRRATVDDADALTRMAMEFIAYTPHGALIDIGRDELRRTVVALLETKVVVCFVAELEGELVAMFVGAMIPIWFAPNLLMAMELAWWVDKRARGTTLSVRLLRKYEQWARANGARFITMSSLEMDTGPNVGSMLARLGYAPAETTHLKEA